MKTVKVDLPYLVEDEDRHGRVRLYVRRFAHKIRIRAVPGSPAFLEAYRNALESLGGPKVDRPELRPFARGSFGWVAQKYFAGLDPAKQKTRRGVLEECMRELYPLAGGVAEPIGHCPIDELTPAKIKWLRDIKAKAGLKGAANNRRKYISAMISWALEQTPALAKSNPARDVKRISYATSGFHTWTVEEVYQFRDRFAVGTKPRLALELLLLLGVRRQDVVTLGRQHRRGNTIHMIPKKTSYRRRRVSEKPILPELADVIARSACEHLTFLVTEYGKPFTAAGFGNWFRDRCNEAGLPHCAAHGLRKAGATIAATNGASAPELMAIYDWETLAVAQKYIEEANRATMAARAMPLIVPPPREGGSPTAKNAS